MFDRFKKDCWICVAAGAVAGIVGMKLVKTDKARKMAVQTIAYGMMAKDCAMEEVANLREEAEEICCEARAVAKQKSDCDCDCGCDCGCADAE